MAERWLFFHGWAMGPWYFKGLLDHLPQRVLENSWAFDRGYFGAPSGPVPLVEGAVVFAHSYGLHWVPPKVLAKARALVVFSGFEQFHPSEAGAKKISQRGLKQMLKGLDQDLPGTLEGFYRLCSAPGEAKFFRPAAGHRARLSADLAALDQARLDPEILAQAPPALLLQGSADQVVTPEAVWALKERFKQAEVQVIEGQAHDLGFDLNPDLWRVIHSWVA